MKYWHWVFPFLFDPDLLSEILPVFCRAGSPQEYWRGFETFLPALANPGHLTEAVSTFQISFLQPN
jgi:hypothetical protein